MYAIRSYYESFIDSNHHVPMIIWFILSFIILWAIFKFIKKKSIIEYCNFSRISLKNSVLMVYIGIGGFIFNTALINISFIDRNFPEFDASLKYIYEGSFVIFAILSAVIIGPIYEEILFRGVIFNELRSNIPLPVAIIIQSIMYGVLFFNIPLGLFCFVAALLYSFIYIKLKTLWSLIILEFVQTFSVLLSRKMGIEDVISDIGDIYIIPAFIIRTNFV